MEIFVTLFSENVRPRRLKLGTHVDSGQMYRVYWNQAAPACLSLYFFIFLLSNFQTLKFFITFFSGTVCLEDWNLVSTWTVGRCIVYTRIRLLLLICPFISSFFFLSNFQTLKFFITLFSGTVCLEDWNLVQTWTVGRCIVYTRIRLLLLFIPLFLHFSFQFSNIKFFCHTLLRNCEASKTETWYTCGQWTDVSCVLESGCCCLFIPLFFIFLSLQFSNMKIFCHAFLRNCEA